MNVRTPPPPPPPPLNVRRMFGRNGDAPAEARQQAASGSQTEFQLAFYTQTRRCADARIQSDAHCSSASWLLEVFRYVCRVNSQDRNVTTKTFFIEYHVMERRSYLCDLYRKFFDDGRELENLGDGRIIGTSDGDALQKFKVSLII